MLKLLKENTAYRKIVSALFVSELGSWFTYMLLIVLSYEKTRSILTTMGIVGFSSIGGLIGGAIAGVFIERKPPAIVITITNIISVGVLISLFFLPTHFAVYYIAAFLIAILGSFRNPAFNKFLVMVVKKDDLMEANSLFQFSREIVKIIGPALAVATLAALPEDRQNIGFLVDATTYTIATIILITSLKAKATDESQQSTDVEQKKSFKEQWLEGLEPFKLPMVSSVLIMFFFIILGIGGVDVTLTAHVSESGNTTLYVGYIIGSLALGILLSSLFAAKLVKNLPLSFKLGVMAVCIGIFYMGIGLSGSLILMMLSAFVLGCFNAIYNVSSMTFFQQTVPYDKIGRFFSLVTSVFSAVTLLGMLVNGLIAELMSPKFVIIVCGIVIAFVGFFGMLRIAFVEKSMPKVSSSANKSEASI